MKNLIIICTLMLLAGCSGTPKPMKYMAVDMPKTIIVTDLNNQYVEVTKHKFYTKPQNVTQMVSELQNKAKLEVLKDADVRIRIPWGIYILAYGYDTAFTGFSK